ncbi:GNAT family N-acetyltransferase [Chitinophaga sp. 22321]|uniref:GNAT family N-acetyltransferase n=1 Tax=Chitinophaga hostae TaxID=2831022 RepID=A0ABS5JAY9_9BACT|nr:GNAT family N-acetyltransferase [Chitinophaga hostae]MBS0032378.1 GNAT family N-acetyltransferase [Chitinophaga hostae]
MEPVTIRTIVASDDPIIANIVKTTLTEFGMNKAGTAFSDPTTDHLSVVFDIPRAIYFVAETEGRVIGGAGIHPLDGGEAHVCELQKMYLLPESRGKGLAGKLITMCLDFAKQNGYTQCYLETSPELARARKVYEQFGFRYLTGPLGNTGHFGCDSWMLKDL